MHQHIEVACSFERHALLFLHGFGTQIGKLLVQHFLQADKVKRTVPHDVELAGEIALHFHKRLDYKSGYFAFSFLLADI
ncbi:hypothetical protein D3C85_1807960 [compost metagenome]